MIFSKNKKIKYFACFDKNLGIGIENKINGFVESAEKSGWQISKKFYHKTGIIEHLKLGYDIFRCEEKHLILRSTAHSLIFIYPFCLITSINKNIVLEVPTPHITSLFELINTSKFNLKTLFKAFLLIILGPLTFLPFKKIIEYSEEGFWWTLFSKKKIFITTNGINLNKVPIRKSQPEVNDTINLIGVANISFWHGFDRIINAINYSIKVKKINYKINFLIIGQGAELENLRNLVVKNQLEDFVKFVPFTTTNDLNYFYSISHLAVGSLGLHRKNLVLASELKAREYVAFGIPFIASGIDLDFKIENSFRFEVTLDDSILPIVELFDKIIYGKIILPNKHSIRKYAENYLDMEIKVNQILSLK